MRFWLIRPAKWLVPEARCFALPVAVKRKRFFVPLWVFIFGMIGNHSRLAWVQRRVNRPVIITDPRWAKRGISVKNKAPRVGGQWGCVAGELARPLYTATRQQNRFLLPISANHTGTGVWGENRKILEYIDLIPGFLPLISILRHLTVDRTHLPPKQ